MRMKARRGAVVVMLGIMMVALVSVTAVSIDFSRLWALRNELQTSADAAAHAAINLRTEEDTVAVSARATFSLTRAWWQHDRHARAPGHPTRRSRGRPDSASDPRFLDVLRRVA